MALIRLWGPTMPQSYSGDLRERVIGTVEAGASRREAADLFEISISSAIRWVQRWHEDGSSEPKPRGGSRSVLEDYAERILALVAEHPDWTLNEILAKMHKQGIPGSRTALWRFLDRHDLTYKKKPMCSRATSSRRKASAPGLDSAARIP